MSTTKIQQVRILDLDPIPASLRGREATLERATDREAIVLVGGNRRRVPVNWLADSSRPEQGSTASDQGTSHSDQIQSVEVAATQHCSDHVDSLDLNATDDSGGDDDPITEQSWNDLLEACRKLGIGRRGAMQIIAEAAGIPAAEIGPSRLTWRNFLQVIERLEVLQGQPDQPTPPPPPPSPPPPPAVNKDAAKAIYPPPSKYLGVAAYNELRAIASHLGLGEEEMVAQLGIPSDCPGYLLDRPWIFAIVRGLAAIATGRQPSQPNLSKAVLRFGYRLDDGPRLVIVGLDGTLLHGDPVMVVDWARQLRIPVEGTNAAHSTVDRGIPQSTNGRDPAHPLGEEPTPTGRIESISPGKTQVGGTHRTTNGSPTISSTGMSKTQQPQKQSEDDPVIDKPWDALLDAYDKAGISHLHFREKVSEAIGIQKSLVGTIPLTRSQFQRAMDYLANCRRGTRD